MCQLQVKYNNSPLDLAHRDGCLDPGPDDGLQRIQLLEEVQLHDLEPVKMKETTAIKYQKLHYHHTCSI